MSAFFSLQIPPPANWQDFEILCCDLWRAIWKDSNTQRNGRQGQPQHGVDIYGRPNQGRLWAGVQCKGKDNYADKKLTEKEVKTEVEKAKSFNPKISQFIIATTGPKDARIEELARTMTEEHFKNGLFSVHVWGWSDIAARLADFPRLMEKYYPGLSLDTRGLKREIDTLKEIFESVPRPRMDVMVYSIYVDILGFENIVFKIAKEKGIDQRTVRDNLINTIKEKVETLEKEGRVIADQYGGRGDWYTTTDDLDSVFRVISEILDHNTGFRGYEKMSLEISVGTIVHDREVDVCELTYTYNTWCKQYYDQKIESTFIVLTESVYEELEPLDRKMCTQIDYQKEDTYSTFFAADVNRVSERGKVFTFLEKIGYPESRLYGRIDEVYVPPAEYEDIRKILKEKRIVFITGTREYGKTYTAVRLMWEYYKRGYEPKWMKGGEEKERIKVRENLEDIGAVLAPHHIFYFEDPFGKRVYEGKEGLEREIGTIIDSVKQLEDTYVIMTSREEIFKEFEKEKLSQSNIREFEKRLTLKSSYDYEKRKQILAEWAESENCQWYQNDDLKKYVFKTIKDEKVLPTPLSMRTFSKATVWVDTDKGLEEKIEEKSEETAMAFAREIKHMSDDKILFLVFLFILRRFKIDFVKQLYEELGETLQIPGMWEFDRVLQWFKDDKVTVSELIEFSHASYAEALKYILTENGFATQINENIFCKVLICLAEKDEVAEDVAWTVAYNYDHLPDVQNVLFTLVEKDDVARMVAWNIAHNFCDLSEDVQNLLFTLVEKDEVAEDVAWTVAYNYDHLPGSVQNVLFALAEKDGTAPYVAYAVSYNFDRLPGTVRNNLLVSLSQKDGAAEDTARTIVSRFDEIPDNVRNNLLLTLAKKDGAAKLIARTVVSCFDEIPDNVRNNLLVSLSRKDEAAEDTARTVVNRFDEIPDNIINKLLLNLSRKDEAAELIARVVVNRFDNLSRNVRITLLFNLSEKDGAARDVAHVVVKNFNTLSGSVRNKLLVKLPDNVRDTLLVNLSERDDTAMYAARCVAKNFKKLPDNVKTSMLLNLAVKDKVVKDVTKVVVKNFSNLPDSVRDNLLLKLPDTVRHDILLDLSEKDASAEAVAKFVIKNFESLPPEVRNSLLQNLSERERTARYVAQFVDKNFNKLPGYARNNLLATLSEKKKTLKYVSYIVAKNFNKFPRHVRNDLLLKLPDTVRHDILLDLSEKDASAEAVAKFVIKNFNKLPEVRNSILQNLSEREGAAGTIAGTVVENFERFPPEVRNSILQNLSEREGAAEVVAGLVTHNFKKFPQDVRNNLLLNLSEREGTVKDAVKIVAKNFDKLPGSIRNKRLLNLAQKDEVSGDVIQIVEYNFDKLPDTVRNKLLVTLSQKEKAAGDTVKIVVKNFDKLPDTVKNKLFLNLSTKNEAVNLAAKLLAKNYDQFPEDTRLFLFRLSRKG